MVIVLVGDADAHKIAIELGIDIRKHPCNLNNLRAYTEGGKVVAQPKDPIKRNHDMVDCLIWSDDFVLAGPKELTEVRRSGTWATIRYAIKNKKKVIIVFPDGGIKEV